MNITLPNQKTLAKQNFREFRENIKQQLLAGNIIHDDNVRFVFKKHAGDERSYVEYTLKRLFTYARHSLDELLQQGSCVVLGGKPVPQAVVEPVQVEEQEQVQAQVEEQEQVQAQIEEQERADNQVVHGEDVPYAVAEADSDVLARVKTQIAEMKTRLEAELSIGTEKFRQASSKVGIFRGRNHADKCAQVKMLGALTQAFADVRTARADDLASIRDVLKSIEVTARPVNIFPKQVDVSLGGAVFSAPEIRAAHTVKGMSAFVSHLDVEVMHRLRAAPAALASSNNPNP